MSHVFVAFALTAAVGLLLTPLVRRLAVRLGALDRPDGSRKLQSAPVPYLGGLALFGALTAGAVGAAGVMKGGSLTAPLITGSTLICLVGWCDDRFGLRVRWKLLGQVLATLPLVLSGQILTRLECFGWDIEMGWGGVPVTVAWLVACANAVNFIDGMDGLAASLGISTAAVTCLTASHLGNTEAMLLAAVLAGALAGFLQYNWQPASIYLGDAGSMTVGLWLGALTIAGSYSVGVGSRLVVLLALASVPLVDVGLAVIRRLLNGRRFWLPDRAHIHHRLLDQGWDVGKIVAVLAAVSLASGAIAFAAAVHGRELPAWAALAMLLSASVRFGLMGRHEIEMAGQFLIKRLPDALAIVSTERLPRRLPTSAEFEQLPPTLTKAPAGSDHLQRAA